MSVCVSVCVFVCVCDDSSKDTTAFEFRRLQILNASRNMLTFVKLVNPSLTEINLSHNELIKLPDFSSLTQLSKLLLSHNYIDDMLLDNYGPHIPCSLRKCHEAG